jgi:DNA-binding response OmpR family regulator
MVAVVAASFLGRGMVDGAVKFGETMFDAAHGRLWRAGRSVELDRPTAAILRTLVADADTDVHKDRLLEAGWPGRTVHENSLAKAVSRLRHILGADGEALKTVHGYGYRLVADPVAAEWPSRGAAGSRRKSLALGFAALFAVAATWVATSVPPLSGAAERPLIKGEPADSIGRVLWVDDHPENNGVERDYLERRKVSVYQVVTSEEALQLLAMYDYDAVISDMNRHDKPLDGLNLVKEMRRRGDRTPFVLYSVVPSEAQRRLVTEAGGQAATVERYELYRVVAALLRDSKA